MTVGRRRPVDDKWVAGKQWVSWGDFYTKVTTPLVFIYKITFK